MIFHYILPLFCHEPIGVLTTMAGGLRGSAAGLGRVNRLHRTTLPALLLQSYGDGFSGNTNFRT
jgi:hypothetical protein